MLRISFNIFSRREPTTNRIQLSLLKLLRCEGGRQKVNFFSKNLRIFFFLLSLDQLILKAVDHY